MSKRRARYYHGKKDGCLYYVRYFFHSQLFIYLDLVISFNFFCSRVGVLKGDGCRCSKCRPLYTTELGRDVITVDSNAVLDPRIITNGIFTSFDDAVKCCDRLNISKLHRGNSIIGKNMSRKRRIKCSGCNRQFMTFKEISGSEWRLYSHETLESYIAHDCEGNIFCEMRY